jgi:hypothetical protein
MNHQLVFHALIMGAGLGLLSACHDNARPSEGAAAANRAAETSAVIDSAAPAAATAPLIPVRAPEPFVDRSGAPRSPGADVPAPTTAK